MTDPVHDAVAELATVRQESDDITHATMATAPWFAVDENGRAHTYRDRPLAKHDPVTAQGFWAADHWRYAGTVNLPPEGWRESLRHYDAARRVWVKP